MNKKKILIIDDDPIDRLLLREHLQFFGHTVDEADDGEEGIRMYRAGRYDLVITDIMMPKESGIGVVVKLKAQFPSARIVTITSGTYDESNDFSKMTRILGATASLNKPITRENLSACLESILGTEKITVHENSCELKDAVIMVVDDDPMMVELIEGSLKTSGYSNTIGITDPRDVDSAVASEEPDIILLDLNMPHKSGFKLLEELKVDSLWTMIPTLVLTSQHDHKTKLRALDCGAMDFISKPFEKVELLTRIRNLLTVRMLQKRLFIQNEELELMVQERTEELSRSRQDVIEKLGKAAEFRDDETSAHVDRVSTYCRLICSELGLDETFTGNLANAAKMHDVGKIGISDTLLYKPGKLTPEERECMKTHTLIGAAIFEGNNSELMLISGEVALTHHEKWDGTGYPNQLSKEEIPLSGRICAIADVFDALSSNRPYKEVWPIERAKKTIQKERGKHFDPNVVDAFFATLPEIIGYKMGLDDSLDDNVLKN